MHESSSPPSPLHSTTLATTPASVPFDPYLVLCTCSSLSGACRRLTLNVQQVYSNKIRALNNPPFISTSTTRAQSNQQLHHVLKNWGRTPFLLLAVPVPVCLHHPAFWLPFPAPANEHCHVQPPTPPAFKDQLSPRAAQIRLNRRRPIMGQGLS